MSATVGVPYSFTFTLTGIPFPTTSLTSGTLPPGLSLDTSGDITGTPTLAGNYTFTVTATNSVGAASTTVTLAVSNAHHFGSTGYEILGGSDGGVRILKRVTTASDILSGVDTSATQNLGVPGSENLSGIDSTAQIVPSIFVPKVPKPIPPTIILGERGLALYDQLVRVKTPYTYTDKFNRANNSSSLGNNDQGIAWIQQVTAPTTWGIQSNQAQITNTGGGGDPVTGSNFAVFNHGDANVSISLDCFVNVESTGIVYRWQDISNFFTARVLFGSPLYQVQFEKVIGGVFTVIVAVANIPTSSPTNINIIASGNQMSYSINKGAFTGSFSDSHLLNATSHGILASENFGEAVDNYTATLL